MLELRTRGTLAASADSPDGVRQLARGKPVALLAYLSAAPGRRASRERLATLLWSDGSSEQARQNLRQTVWYIRRRLGPVLEASDDFLTITGDTKVDRDAFALAVREQRLAEALQLYAGDFIPDFAAPGAAEFEQWCDVERRRLRSLFIGCTDTLARQALGKGQAARAADLARRARDVAPYDLAPWRLLLESLVAARDPVGAMAEAESLEAMLAAQELDADDATRAAMRTARNASNAGRSALSTSIAANGSVAIDEHASFSPEMIGRESEFSALLERWELTKSGRGSAVLVTGVAGLGKSRLLADLHARLRASRARAVLVRANPGDRAVAGGFAAALAESIAQRPGSAGISSESAGVLVALAPALASVYTQASPDRSSGEDAQRRRVSALLELLRSVSEDSALALLVDDLHWVDQESRRLLDAVAARLEGGRALLVLAARPPIESLGGFSGLPRVELARLDLARVAEFIARLGELPLEPWAANLPSQLASATRGIPLTIIEALQRLIEEGSLTLRAQRWSSAAPGRIVEVLRDGAVLENRVRSLSAGPRELLLLLATLGRPMRADAIGADSRLTELEQRGFVARVDGELHVGHDEVADAALAVATNDEREAAHARAAAILAAEPSGESTLMLAARHAVSGNDAALLRRLAERWVRGKRAAGRGDGAQLLLSELLGAEVGARTRALALSGISWLERPSRMAWRVAAAFLFVVVSVGGRLMMMSGVEPDVEYIVRLDGDTLAYARIAVSDIDIWNRDEPVRAELLEPSELPEYLAIEQRVRLTALPDGSGLMGTAFFPDSGGDEVVFVDERGQLQRPMYSSGDDNGLAPSPDGRFFAFSTARWNKSTDRYQVAIYDRTTQTVRRVTNSGDYDSSPFWSPDGTRLAFLRNSFTKVAPLQLCVIAVDGKDERCDWPSISDGVGLHGWVDDVRVMVEEVFTGRNFIYNLETHERESSLDGNIFGEQIARVVLVGSRESGGGLLLARPEIRGAERRVLLNGRPLRGTPTVTRGRLLRRQRFADSVAVNIPSGELALDLSHRLVVEAFDSAGMHIRAHAVRMRPLDPTLARLDGDILRPLRSGVLALEVTLGGWRTDTLTLRIVPSSAQRVLTEDWEGGFRKRWRSYGNPPALFGRTARFATLRPNGDGKYASGAYLVDTLPLDWGLGMETSFSLPVNRLQWQSLGIGLTGNVPRGLLAAWDHRTGNAPTGDHLICAVSFGGEGGSGFTHYMLIGHNNESVRAPAPRSLFTGQWHQVRLQYFPDGRCGVALDGAPALMTNGKTRMVGNALLIVSGHSVETTVQVGPLSVWTGVLGGVDWARLDHR